MIRLNCSSPTLDPLELNTLHTMWQESLEDILNCTTLAGCGHPGGSMSSIHFLLVLYALANVRLDNYKSPDRDRIIVSHGHISPGVYAALAQFKFFPREEMVLNFRKFGPGLRFKRMIVFQCLHVSIKLPA